MSHRRIVKIRIGWQDQRNTGKIQLQLEGVERARELKISSAAELTAMLELLRHEPVYFDEETEIVYTDWIDAPLKL